MVKISPSILSADFGKLQDEIDSVENADFLHIDIMDGHFVPNLSFGPMVLKNIKTKKKLDWHLMVDNPANYFEQIKSIGAEYVSVHIENDFHIHRTIEGIKNIGAKVGVALNPATPISFLEDIKNDLDMVLVMSVNPGFGGQKFIENTVEKIKNLRKMMPKIIIEIDGGINDKTAKKVINAGSDILVAGSYVFSSKNRTAKIESLR